MPPPGFEWDARKAASNLRKHGVAFDEIAAFEFAAALEVEDDRADYGEARMFALGPIRGVLHALVYTRRNERLRIISLRKASKDEREIFAQARRS